MKNIIKYIGLPSLAIVVFLFVAVNYGQRLRFGDAYFENDTANKILTNKSLYFESGDSIYYNNVVVTSGTGGGGIAASDNITFTGNNTFNQNVTMADSKGLTWANPSSVKSVTGALTYNSISHNFNTQYGTYLFEVDSLTGFNIKKVLNGTYDSITSSSKFNLSDIVTLTDTLKVSGAIAIMDSIRVLSNAQVNGNLSVGGNVTATGNITADSIAGIGVFITDVNAITLKGQDTTHFARTDTLTTEGIKGIWGFWNTVRFYTTATFDVTPVFNALVNFANGTTVTGTATFNGDMVNTGWKNQGAMLTRNKYYRDTLLYMVTTASPPYSLSTFTVAHGVSNWKSIVNAEFLLHDDSLNLIIRPNTFPNSTNTTPYLLTYASVDSLNAKIMIPGTSVALFNDTCTVLLRVTDYNR